MTKINFEIPALLLSCKSLDFLVYKINCTNLVQTAPHNLVAIHVFTNLLLWVEISQKAFFALDDFYWNSKGQFMACIASDKKITLSVTFSGGSNRIPKFRFSYFWKQIKMDFAHCYSHFWCSIHFRVIWGYYSKTQFLSTGPITTGWKPKFQKLMVKLVSRQWPVP